MTKLSLLVPLLCLSAAGLGAATVFSDDFESYATGLDKSVSSSPKLYNALNIADESISTVFGSPNQFAYLDGGSSFVRVNSVSTLMTYSFDMLEPDTAQTGIVRFGFGSSDIASTNNAYAAWTLNNGTLLTSHNTAIASGSLPTLLEDRRYTVYIAYNGSASSQTVAGSGDILAAGQTALYFQDSVTSSLISAGIYNHTRSTPITPGAFLIRSASSDDNTLYFDNIVHQDILGVPANIPEPGATALLVGAAALFFALRRDGRRT